MKNQLNKILAIIIFILFFSLFKSYAIEDVSDLTDAITEAREKFDNASEAVTDQSKIIDEAIKEIDKATEYVQDAIINDNAEDAIKTLNFIEKSLVDVGNIIPQEFSSDMTNIDISGISKEDMNLINELTAQMNVAKVEKENEFMSELMDLNLKGIDTVSISENLNGMGVDTIKLVLDVDGAENLEKWTKEQWADSYTGSIVTSAGNEAIPDNEINNKVVDLEQQLQTNSAAILDKRTSLTELQSKIDPLSNQISNLEAQKTNLLAKYNEEIVKQSSAILSGEEMSKSKELAGQLSSQLSNVTNEIQTAESQSSALQQQIQSLNLDLTNEIANKTKIEDEIINLNSQITANKEIISQKSLELDKLKNTDLKDKVAGLNDRLESTSLQRDFIQTQFERSIDKEVEHFQIYGNVFKDADMSETEIDFAFREVGALLDGDPRRSRAFEIEKYGTFAGLSEDEIQSGINAALNDDWDTQKSVVKNIYNKLSNNPNWVVNKPSTAELNVLIAEEKAIQEAVFTLEESRKVQEQVDKIVNERTEQYQDFATIDPSKVSLSFTRLDINGNLSNAVVEGTKEGKLVAEQFSEILSNNQEFSQLQKSLKEKNDLYSKILEEGKAYREMIDKYNSEISKISNQAWEARAEINKINLEKNEYLASINEADPTVGGGIALLYRAQGQPDHSKWTKTVREFDAKIGELNRVNTVKTTEALNKYSEQMIAMRDFETSGDQWTVKNEINNLQFESVKIQSEAAKVARENVINLKDEAVNEINKIRTEEIAKTGGLYNTEDAIFEILDQVPTFDEAQRKRAKEVISGGYYRIGAGQIIGYDDKAAGLIAALDGDENTYDAFKAAVDNAKKIGETPAFDSHYYEMTNVKLAAIVHSKLNGNYSYTHYNEDDKLQLSTSQRAELEKELEKMYGSNNPTLLVLNGQVDALKSEINKNNSELANLNENISKLESELSSLKNSEGELEKQINDLTNQFSSKESLIAEKTKNLTSIQEQLNPISNKINELQGQRTELDGKLNEQLSTIANQVKDQGEVSDEANRLKAEFESQIAQLDNQIKEFENQSNEINNQLTSITTELSVLEAESPEIANQIANLNQDLENFKEVKAELAMATAKKLGLNVNEKALKSVKVIDGKVVIALEGTNLVSVVDKNKLIDDPSKFIDPTTELSVNTKVYTANALNKELVTPEFITAAKTISVSQKVEVIAQSSAIETVGATTEQSKAFANAKAARLAARKEWDDAVASGDKVAAQAAEDAFMAAKKMEQASIKQAAAAVAQSSVANQAAQVAQAAAQDATAAAQDVAQVASAAAQEAASEVKETVQAAAKTAQEAALDALWAMEQMPGSSGMHTLEVTAAIRQLQAEMNGNEFNYLGAKSYEEAMQKIAEAEKAGKTQIELENELGNHDVNRMGPCGKASC